MKRIYVLAPFCFLNNSNVVYAHSVLGTYFFHNNNEIQELDGRNKITNKYHNAVFDSKQESLPSLIQSDIDSLHERVKAMSNDINDAKHPLSHVSPQLIRFLEDTFKESFENATNLKDELLGLMNEKSNYDDLFDDQMETNGEIAEGSVTTPVKNIENGNNNTMDPTLDVMQTVENIIKEIKGTENEAKQRVEQAVSELYSYKVQATEDAKNRANEIKNNLHLQMKQMVAEMESNHRRSIDGLRDINKDRGQNALFDLDLWEKAGYMYSNPGKDTMFKDGSDAVQAIKALPLRRYRLANDTKQNVLVAKGESKDEARSRTHIGIIDEDVLSNFIDPALYDGRELDNVLIQYVNLEAISGLAEELDTIKSQLRVLKSFTSDDSEVFASIKGMKDDATSRVSHETIGDLAARVALLEAESTSKNVSLHLQNIKQSLRVHQVDLRLEKLKDVTDVKLDSSFREMNTTFELQKLNDKRSSERHQVLSSLLQTGKVITGLMESVNSTTREIEVKKDKANNDIFSQIAQIKADANEERKQEINSLKRIHILGEESRKALIQMIEVIFGHIVEGLFYLITNEKGRKQMCVAIISIIALTFSIAIFKELITIIFNYILRTISMPKLVREWGSGGLDGKRIQSDLHSIVLREEEKRRIHLICDKLRKGRRRKAPLQNILIHGKSGTGKSMIARSIAKESGLPFAIMSGADIAPLKHLGPTELNNVLFWAQRQRKGGIVIIDEAESALGSRIRAQNGSLPVEGNINQSTSTSSSSRDALNVFLSMTGDACGKIMIILTTSNPSALDDAVLDRCDEILHCDLPQVTERKKILTNEFKKVFTKKDEGADKSYAQNIKKRKMTFDEAFSVDAQIHKVAGDGMTDGFSGRELTKIIRAVEHEMFLKNKTLNEKHWSTEVDRICVMMKNKKHLNKAG